MCGELSISSLYLTDKFRFIPTCVGNWSVSFSGIRTSPVHPHVCGELVSRCVAPSDNLGSSPRVWGTALMRAVALEKIRFIPTCVGNCTHTNMIYRILSVHPHVCGELVLVMHEDEWKSGSSPRVWGTEKQRTTDAQGGRFIPTCVGNWLIISSRRVAHSVHPHVCGELHIWRTLERDRAGSSPRVWGTAGPVQAIPVCFRFIPTCVGNC